MTKVVTRGTQLDMEKIVKNVGGNRFELILAAANRAREIRYKNLESDQFQHVHPIVTALIDIQEGNVGREYLFKDVRPKRKK